MQMRILPKHDSRDLHYHARYGQIAEFPKEFSIKDSTPEFIQPPGNFQCTCITMCDIASDRDGNIYDVDDLWNRIPHDASGADPRDALTETVRNGLLPRGDTAVWAETGQFIRRKDFRSYWTAHTGALSPFDNIRSALMLANYPVAIWSPWYREWSWSTILTQASTRVGFHCYVVEGWTEKYGVPMLIVQAWTGREMYMSETTFNWLAGKWGFGSAVLSADEVEAKRTKTYLESIVDGLQNIALGLMNLLASKKKLK